MKEIVNFTLKGVTEVGGMKFQDIEGGFGKNKKSMLVKDIATIHEKEYKHVNEAINSNRKRFKNGVDILDLKSVDLIDRDLLNNLGFSNSSIANANNIYILSERGYSKLLKILEDDTAWEQYEKLVDGYFEMRKDRKKESEFNAPPILNVLNAVKFIADDLKVNETSKIRMYRQACKDEGLKTNFLPTTQYREKMSGTDILKKFNIPMSIIKFNKLMVEHGFLEERKRSSTNKQGYKTFKILTEKGLKYGENESNSFGSSTQGQPLYYEETFMDLINFLNSLKGVSERTT